MKTFIYYSKSDNKKEILGRGLFSSPDLAVKYFSEIKRLNIYDFIKLYIVSELK